MTAQVDYWSFNYDDTLYTWTVGKDYEVSVSDGVVHVESDTGSGDVPVECCNTDLFDEVFGLDITV